MNYFEYEVERVGESLDDIKRNFTVLSAKANIFNDAISALCEKLPDFEPAEGAYGYVSSDASDFLGVLLELEKVLKNDPDYSHSDLSYRPCAFLEIGCGPGRNIFLLKHAKRFHFHKVVGFDISDVYVEHGRKYFGLGNDLFIENCMTFDYGGFDILYFYRPFHDEEQENAFEDRLVTTTKRGAYVVGFSSSQLNESRLLMRMGDSGRIWKKL